MSCSIFLCDRDWNIRKVFYESGSLLKEGDSLAFMIPEAQKNKEKLAGENSGQVLLFLCCPGREKEPCFLYLYPEYAVAVIGCADGSGEFVRFEQALVESLDWADSHLRVPFEDDFYEIQRMNNRLVNAGRSLMKTNQQLTELLAEVHRAHNTIAVLERDELTQLYGLSAFRQACSRRLAEEPSAVYQMICVDVSGLHHINEIFGEKAGDRLIRDIALFMTGLSGGERALFCRQEAASFVVMAPGEAMFSQQLFRNLPRFFDYYPLPGHLKARIGVAETRPGEAVSAAALCDQARVAMDRGPSDRKISMTFFDDALKKKLKEEYDILEMVPRALRRQEFKLYLQNKVDMESGEVIGAEGLVRWMHPEKGMISPGLFIPLLEREEEVYQVDLYIWEEACRVLQQRMKAGRKARPISVNLARSDLYRPDLPGTLKALVHRYGISPSLLHLEVLERVYVHDAPSLLPVLLQLRQMGFIIEIDDFGTGESSLFMLAEMPVDVLKLDRSFVHEVEENIRCASVVQSIAAMARSLHLSLIVEGVETREQAEQLQNLGCRYVQGFYYSRPAPAEEFLKLP
ncbi:putative bifunctional diguanylate cyclase/phosphodiesterase [Dialister sp.]|uniref:putative bifunctional diguanylate cyclase/phosphodiesterase n=1 Tax=Dialister sp. TaxID=1955814 RepID=UPI003F0028D6